MIQAWNRHLAKEREHWNSLTVAHQADATGEIFEIARRIHVNDPDTEGDRPGGTQRVLKFSNGSKYRCMTAMGNYGASGSDTYALHVSEAALLENKSGQDADNLTAMVNSMPQGEGAIDTSLVLEGTGNGPFGDVPSDLHGGGRSAVGQ